MSKNLIQDVSTAGAARQEGDSAQQLAPALTIISHPWPQRLGERSVLHGIWAGSEVLLSRNTPVFQALGRSLGAPLSDPFVSRSPIHLVGLGSDGVRLISEEGGTKVSAGSSVRGTLDFSSQALTAGVPLELAERVVLLLHLATVDPGETSQQLGLVGRSLGVQQVREHIVRISDLEVPVLIRGETGSGKELVARAIHESSRRKKGPFVSVNLGAIPKELAAAELFGAHKGAYTGAVRDRSGFFMAARGGTLFLDEVGEAPAEVQVMLLRVLETGEIYPVGSQTPVATDVRILAATDADLEEQIRTGRFRAPLLHRLSGYEIRVPPLRERREDLGLLFLHFAREELTAIGETHHLLAEDPYTEPWLPASLAMRLLGYGWPGNIRQLRNVTRQLVIGSRGRRQLWLDPRLERELGLGDLQHRELTAPEGPRATQPRRKPSQVQPEELVTALKMHAWDLKGAADQLGIPRPSIYDLIERTPGLRTAGDLSAEEIAKSFRECGGDVDAMVQQLQVSKRALIRRLKEMAIVP